MNDQFLAILKRIIAEQGESVLADAKRVRGQLSDFAADVPKAQKNTLVKCLEYGLYAELKNAPEENRAAVKDRLAQKLHDEEGLDSALCAEAMNLLETAVFGDDPARTQTSAGEEEWVTVAEQREMAQPPEAQPVSVGLTAASTTAPIASASSQDDEEQRGEADALKKRLEEKRKEAKALKKNLEEQRGEAEAFKKRLQKTKNGLAAVIIIGILALASSIGVGVQQYHELDDFQTWRYDSLESRYKTLQSDYAVLLNNWVISVTAISIGNANADNKWINSPGEKLSASAIRYLNPVITYDSRINGEVTLYIKILRPDGTLVVGTSSPSGYTFTKTRYINSGKDRTWDLYGWGNSDKSTFSSGNWQVEIWYEGIRIGSTTVTLN
jgi:hypothetical protein